jgi:hypothetical protein
MTDERGEDRRADDARAADEAAWAQIVASLRTPSDPARSTWPAAENLDEDADEQGPARDAEPEPEPAESRQVIIWRGSEQDIDAEIERAIPDEHFVPPDPPPLPQADAITWAAWAGVIGGPLVLLLVTALGVTSGLLVVVAAAGFLGGFAVLLTRMRQQRDPYDPDDGAVV